MKNAESEASAEASVEAEALVFCRSFGNFGKRLGIFLSLFAKIVLKIKNNL